MKSYLYALAVGLLLVFPVIASEAHAIEQIQTATTTGLPDDSTYAHVSVIVSDNWNSIPEERELVRQYLKYKAEPETVHWHFYTRGNPIFRARLAHRVNVFPCVILQGPDGAIENPDTDISSGKNCEAWFKLRLWRKLNRCRPCKPTPQPTPAPPENEPQIVEPQIIVQPLPEPEPENDIEVLIVILCGVFAAICFYAMENQE